MSLLLLLSEPSTGGTPAFTPTDIAGLALWLDAPLLGLANDNPVSPWPDLSGSSHDATAVNSAVYKADAGDGKPAVYFDGVNDNYSFADFLSGETEGEIFIQLKRDADPDPTPNTALWWFGSSVSADHVPYDDGTIYDGFGSTSRKTTVNPTDSLASWCVYNVTSKAGGWTSRLNGTQIYTTASNTVGFTSTPFIGRSYDPGYWYKGYIRRIVVYDHELSSGDRASVLAYMA